MQILIYIVLLVLAVVAIIELVRTRKKMNQLLRIEGHIDELSLLHDRGLLDQKDQDKRMSELHNEI